MPKLLWLIVGVGIGFVVAHQINKTPEGKSFFADVEGRAQEFGSAVKDGYKTREAELRSALGDD